MDSKLWNEIESNVPIRIKGDYYILQAVSEFRILQKNDIVEFDFNKIISLICNFFFYWHSK